LYILVYAYLAFLGKVGTSAAACKLAFIWFYLLKVGKDALYLVFFRKTGVCFVFD
tara:strand:+ start:1116 stop:1280 length:165 start_codon:yes stop_codon:yes gene_type:complete